MTRLYPRSLGFFVVMGAAFLLQTLPPIGIVLLITMAPFWSIPLVNAGMIGTAFEAASGRVSRWWLVLPLAFYGAYWTKVAADCEILSRLIATNDAVNAPIVSVFDPTRHALVFEDHGAATWLTQNYALPVVYSVASNRPEGHLAHRIMERSVCDRFRSNRALTLAAVQTSVIFDGDDVRTWREDKRFCKLSLPERPALPQVRISTREIHATVSGVPVTRRTTTIVEPDGRRLELAGGMASPLGWLPQPVLGCFFDEPPGSSTWKWTCAARLRRDDSIPIVSAGTRFHSNGEVLARALGLAPLTVAERRGVDPNSVMPTIAAAEKAALAVALIEIEARIADPSARVDGWHFEILVEHPEVVARHAAAITAGLERAAAANGHGSSKTRDSGHILGRLLASLPRDDFAEIVPRLTVVFARADQGHWLWELDTLRKRMGEFGQEPAPHPIDPPQPVP